MVTVLVCGANRSGTSLMMRCLEQAGIGMAGDMIGGNAGNVHGYYESKSFKDLCNCFLRNKTNRSITIKRIRNLLGSKENMAWKYPRAVFMLDVIHEAIPDIIVLHMNREKKDVVESCIRHCVVCKVKPAARSVYSSWHDNALKSYRNYGHKKIKVNFKNLVSDELGVTNRVLSFCGLSASKDFSALDEKQIHFGRR